MARLLQQAFHQTRVSKKRKCSLPDIHEKIISPSAPMSYCVKNSRPFDVATMQRAPLAGVGISYSAIITPFSFIRPILLAKFSVNQRSPSAPTVTPRAEAFGVGMANSAIEPSCAMRPSALAPVSTNQMLHRDDAPSRAADYQRRGWEIR